MKTFTVGTIGSMLSPRVVFFVAVLSLFAASILGYRAWLDTSVECVRCHSDRKKVEQLGAPWAYVTDEAVRKESRHPNIQCRDCHLGNGRSADKDSAHSGMLKMLIVSDEGRLLARRTGYPYGVSRTGDDKLFALLPKIYRDGQWQSLPVRNILWHDRDTTTFDFDPRIAEKTCGKSGCHPDAFKQFTTSVMGRNYRQRTMHTWLTPYGPHNCGPSFADQPPPKNLEKPIFDDSNALGIMKETSAPFTIEQARDKQKFCNVCHTGCLDCHYSPGYKEEGVHTFSRVPPAENCSGFGRGSSICHPGSMHSRRGETYIGGDYSVPQGMAPDVHYKKGLGCVACHPADDKGMGHIERKASCQDCHLEIEHSHSRDVHSRMDCATCHISELRGYQLTAWGPGLVAGRENPFNKYSLYYGIQSPPILIKDQKGIWMPVKVWPHSVGNLKADFPRSNGIQFRWPDGETRDAYYVEGTFRIQKEASSHSGAGSGKEENTFNNNQLLWLEIEQAAHPYGPARSCTSCHSSKKQSSSSTWEFLDDQGAKPFTGSYTIAADDKGMRVTNLKATSQIKLMPGYKLSDFAPWLYLKDKWVVPGDFTIRADKNKYREYLKLSKAVQERIKILDARSGSMGRKNLQKYHEIKGLALHNPEEGLKKLNSFQLSAVSH